jgi:carbon storage regulator
MLMMSRRAGETILIGDEIEIVIAHIGRSRVKVGIRAPRETPVVAREVKLVREENITAAIGAAAVDFSTLIARLKPAPEVLTGPAGNSNVQQDAGAAIERISRCQFPSKPT